MEERSSTAPAQTSVRSRGALSEARVGKPANKAKPKANADLIKGQIWKVKENYVQIVDAGKTLIHYTMSPKPKQRGLRVRMATRETVQDFLHSNGAKLVQ